MIEALLVLSLAAVAGAALLRIPAARLRLQRDPVERRVDALLPQTQCGQCNYAGCRPYARAIVAGEADINQCPPGGDTTIANLAALLGRERKPLNPLHGTTTPPMLAVIDEAVCIGCTICIQACPVDAILGASKRMHTVIADECTGCELCVAPCPVDCIDMVPDPRPAQRWHWPPPEDAWS